MSESDSFPKLKITLGLPQYALSELIALTGVVTLVSGLVTAHVRTALRYEGLGVLQVVSITATSATLSLVGARLGIRWAEQRTMVGRARLAFITTTMLGANVAGAYAFWITLAVSASAAGATKAWIVLGIVVVATFLRFKTVIPQVEIRLEGSKGSERDLVLRQICATVQQEDASRAPSRKTVVHIQSLMGERGLHAGDAEVQAAWAKLRGEGTRATSNEATESGGPGQE